LIILFEQRNSSTMHLLHILSVGLALIVISTASLTTSLFHAEQQRLITALRNAPKNDLVSIYYATTALNALGKDSDNVDALCEAAKNKVIQENAESVFQYSEVVKVLKCKNTPNLALAGLLKDDTESLASSQIVAAMINLGHKVDANLIKQFVKNVKDNDTPVSAAAAFYAASLLPKSEELKPIISMVDDINAQADTVDGNKKQYEGGLAVTSSVVKGIILLAEKQQGTALLKQNQLTMLARYLLSRKYVHSLKDIHHLLTALSVLSNNKVQIPVAISVFNTNLLSNDNKVLKVRFTNLLDQSIPDVKLTAKSFSTSDDSVTLFENKAFSKSTGDDKFIIEGEVARGYMAAHSYSLDVMSTKPSRGMYKCKVAFEVSKNAKLYTSFESFELRVKVLAKIVVEDVEIAVGEKDRELAKASSLAYPNKLSSVIEADSHQKIVMTFNLKDLFSKELVTTHQTFIRLLHEESGQEIFFVAEPDSADHYKFTLDVGATAKDSFNNLSGKYKMSLIIGDATMQVPINWLIGELSLTFSGEPKKSKRQERITEARPVIEHMFRVPEKRPSKVVSTAFTALVLSPLLVMFAMWAKVGVNLSNFSFSIPTLLFHVGLAGIFALYYLFWIQLDMFQTLKMLVVVGGLTFLGGNKMLADMAAAKYRS